MSIDRKVSFYANMIASGQMMAPVIKDLLSKSIPVEVYVESDGKAAKAFNDENIPFSLVQKGEVPLDGRLLITGATSTLHQDGILKHYSKEPAVWKAAKEKGIQTIAFLDRYTPSENKGRFTDVDTKEIITPDMIIFPYAEGVADIAHELNYDKSKIIVTGNPHYDSLVSKKQKAQRPYQERVVPVFLGSEGYMEGCKTSNKTLLAIVADSINSNARVVVKAHPKDLENTELMKLYADILGQKGSIDTQSSSDNLAFSLRSDEFCVGANGSLLEQATYLDILALAVWPTGSRAEKLATSEVMPCSYTNEDGIKNILLALGDEAFRKYWEGERSSAKVDGKATERAVCAIKQLL